jgi:hypothetical protein
MDNCFKYGSLKSLVGRQSDIYPALFDGEIPFLILLPGAGL